MEWMPGGRWRADADRETTRNMAKMIPNAELIASLLRKGPIHHCESCGQRMFVRNDSGLCPLCWNGRQPLETVGPVHVDDELALAGILDDTDIDLDILPD